MLILATIVSFFPFIGVYLWLRNGVSKEETHRKLCDKAFGQGVLCIIPVSAFSAISSIALNLSGIESSNPLLYRALHTLIVLALSEEIAKCAMSLRFMKKRGGSYSWLDIVVIFVVVATGFGVFESIIYAFGASIPVVLVRGICVPHVAYGFIVGYFYGKGLKTGNNGAKWIGFAITLLIHWLYDFSLSEEFTSLNDNLVFIPLLLALAEIVLAIVLIVFTRKASKQEKYTEPIPETSADLKGIT